MGGRIRIDDKTAVDAGIRAYGTQKNAVTSIGTDLQSEFDALTAALGITVDGEGADGDVPSGLGDGAKTRAGGAATKLDALAAGWKSWVSGQEVVQEAAATDVRAQGDGKPTEPKQAESKPDTPKPNPAAAPAGTPAAFAMK
ncbi:hypothetical protein [Mycobacteroides abscessus]|uniref:hypothetical protein n=1 Tax=Mycobacteroides abscessus TaxID=36809 RepID=UPI00092C8133|nr:hypothetical protein [Mycobacteroides abscessus]SIF24593.1 Uncharacterised protein [Mycobacteroides abscessus subsp. abscessus]SIF38231.1 Uncharacterised protein [Mycobacteroides abscessus subsp. abscessus]SIF84460.1 Uncharacterised protein [Mycobacteroides abscessus subsp. abscessus]